MPRMIFLVAIVPALTFLSAPASTAAQRSPVETGKPVMAPLAEGEHVAFIKSIQAELKQRHFEALDKTADELLRTKARFPGGDWKLFYFHEALERPGSKDAIQSDQEWEQHIAMLRLWKLERKSSATAAIALGEAWTQYAWQVRGQGLGETVTEDMRRVFQQRLSVAEKALADAGELATNNPQWYRALIVLAQGQGWDLSKVEAVFAKAITIEPLYPHLYLSVAIYLMPRWHGEEGEWERFADVATTRVGGREGAAIYSHIVLRMSTMYSSRQFFVENTLSWPRIRQALADREALYGTDRYILNKWCWMAGAAEDVAMTRQLLARIGDAWDPVVWKERKHFDEYRTWVEEN